jgi:MFS transporter, DHA1 family, inner membrane transport protein
MSAFTRAQVVAVLLVGIVGVLIPGLQPQLLGALAHEGRVSASLLGHVATAELLAMGIAAGAAGFVLSLTRLRLIAAIAIVVAAGFDLLTPYVGGATLVAARFAAGLAEGVLIWIAIGFIVRTAHPARGSGIYLMTQTLAQFALASVLGAVIVPAAGSAGGFTALAVATLVGLVALPWLPRGYAPLAKAEDDGAIPARGYVALAGVLVYLAFVVAVWVYVEPLGAQRGVDAHTIALVAPLSLAMQVLGAGLATLLAGRLPALPTLAAIGVLNLALLAIVGAPPNATAFLAATSVFGFLWLFAMPFQVPAVIAADPTRRAAALIGGAQLIGSSAGPFVAALLVAEDDVSAVLWFGGGCILVALLLLFAAARRPRRVVPA